MMAAPAPPALAENRDFRRLWAAQTVSVFGSLVTRTALPFTAVLALKATPFQMAVLGAADLLPGFLFGLAAGVWVDRLPRRSIMIAADVGRAVILVCIPLAAWLGMLRMEQLYAATFLAGLLTLFFDVAYQAYLPSVVRREDLVAGNSRLTASASVAEFGAFGITGWLVQWFTGPVAILIDAVTYLVSALFLGGIRTPEPRPAAERGGGDFRRELGEGLRSILGQPVLRALAAASFTLDFFSRITGTVYLVFVTRELGVPTGIQGLIYAVGGASALLGALWAGRISARLGVGRTLILALLVTAAGSFFTPLAQGFGWVTVGLMLAAQLVTDPAWTVWEINEVSLRQSITDERMLGRVNGTLRFLGLTAMLLGTFAGGWLGSTIGPRAAMLTSAAGVALASMWLVCSPVRVLRVRPKD